MKSIKSAIYLILVLVIAQACSKFEASNTISVLFIGNSYTYYNSSPELFKALVKEKFPNKKVNIQLVSQGGMTLKRHWEDGKASEAIKSNQWDYVILQEQSKLGMGLIIDRDFYFGQTDLFYEYARKFDAEIKKSGAKTAFFMTWSVKNRPQEQHILSEAYSSIAKELNAKLIPVGLIWDQVRQDNQFDLYVQDGSHPSPHGSYLIATSVFTSLFEEAPMGLSGIIAGHPLSSSGESSKEKQSLVNISESDALVIQKASWNIVSEVQKKGGYLDVDKPVLSYSIPKLSPGEAIENKAILGNWYGTTTYSDSYLGLRMKVENINDELQVKLVFYTPDRQDEFFVKDVDLSEKELEISIMDSLRMMNSKLIFAKHKEYLNGLSESIGGNITNYKHWTLSRDNIQNDIDIEVLDLLHQKFKEDINKEGYVDAALKHYERYSALINEDFIPEEQYLNATGYNLVQDGKMEAALRVFELAMILYPESVNTYDSYGENLIKAGELDKGIMIYTQGYELAKKTGHENVAYMAANLKKYKKGEVNVQEGTPPPPPLPNQ